MWELWQTVSEWIVRGGFVMGPLLLASILVIAVAIERFYYYRAEKCDAPKLIVAMLPSLDCADWAGASKQAGLIGGIAGRVAIRGLSKASIGLTAVDAAMELEANLAASKLRQRLDILDVTVTLAPLLGLLGTVIGMIRTFSVLNIRSGQAAVITGGVGEALIATATGLFVAIMAAVCLAFFRQWLDRMLTDVEEVAGVILAAIADKSNIR